MSKGLVLLTGATGFVGSHVLEQLLAAGYPVRAIARPAKSKNIKAMFPDAKSLEVVEVSDISKGDFTEALKGVESVVHVASAGFDGTPTTIFEGAYEGTINILNQSIKAGVKRFVQTSSYITLFDSTFAAAFGTETLTADSWNPVTKDQIDFSESNGLMGNMMAYVASKSIAEREVWKIADANPQVDITTIVPPGIYGPFVKNYPRPSTRSALGTNNSVYELITGGPAGPNTYPTIFVGHIVDVRDVAKAHILALTTSPIPNKHKRFIIYSGVHTWVDAAKLIAEKRPELKSRLPGPDATPPAQTSAPLDTSFSKEVLGLKSYISWEDTFLSALDEGLKWEAGEKKA